MEDMYHIQFKDKLLGHDWFELYIMDILDAKYQWADVKEIDNRQQHLNTNKMLNFQPSSNRMTSSVVVLLVCILHVDNTLIDHDA
jgi:hypothetical protein